MSSTANFALILKKACPTCSLVAPLIPDLESSLGSNLDVYVQDDPEFLPCIDDRNLEFSYRNQIEIVPTLIRFDEHGSEAARISGWDREQWREFCGNPGLGDDLEAFKPGCGSMTQDPGMEEILTLRFDGHGMNSREVAVDAADDIMEACFNRGWSDGLPVVPPTPLRVLRMLAATTRDKDELVGEIPPDKAPCSIEKVAINAVLAGCKPEYFPTVLAVVEAALKDEFCMHGLLCTTYFSSPLVIVNGPVARQIGVNSGVNALGQGTRANATIGRTVQLLIRNVGGGIPGGIDRATLGTPAKYSFCFAEDESCEQWQTLAQDRGFERSDSVVSLFPGDGIHPLVDQHSRTPESLALSMAATLRNIVHYKLYGMADAVLVVSPEHRRVFQQAGWSKQQLKEALMENLMIHGSEIVRGADNIAEGMPEKLRDKLLCKFRDDGLHIVSAGGGAGMFSAVIGGWVASGERGSQMVSQQIEQPA